MEIREYYVDVNWRVPVNNRHKLYAFKIGEELWKVQADYEGDEEILVHHSNISKVYSVTIPIWNNIWSE